MLKKERRCNGEKCGTKKGSITNSQENVKRVSSNESEIVNGKIMEEAVKEGVDSADTVEVSGAETSAM